MMLEEGTIIIVDEQGKARVKEAESEEQGGFPWWLLILLLAFLGRLWYTLAST